MSVGIVEPDARIHLQRQWHLRQRDGDLVRQLLVRRGLKHVSRHVRG
jgi:hypothetical protein